MKRNLKVLLLLRMFITFLLISIPEIHAEQITPNLGFLEFKEDVTFQEGARKFNEQFKERLSELSQSPLTVDELKNSLAIGSSFFLRPEKDDVANFCNSCLNAGKIFKGSSLVIYTAEDIGKEGSRETRKFFFIFLHIQSRPIVIDGPIPDEKTIAASGKVPVRLIALNLKK